MFKLFFTSLIALSFLSCSDSAIVTRYNEKALTTPIPCMRLELSPFNIVTMHTLQNLYSFDEKCNYSLTLSQKSAIVCNSSFNSDKKALTKFPTSYLSFTLKKGSELLYSYYVDLSDDVEESDIKRGFKRLREDIKLK